MTRRLVYGVCLYAGYWARTGADVLDDVAVLLENVAGELAPFHVGRGAS